MFAQITADDVGKKATVEGYDEPATIRFVGDHHELGKPRIGVEFETPVGKMNGTSKGHQYFKCKKKHGVLVLPSKVKLVNGDEPPAPKLDEPIVEVSPAAAADAPAPLFAEAPADPDAAAAAADDDAALLAEIAALNAKIHDLDANGLDEAAAAKKDEPAETVAEPAVEPAVEPEVKATEPEETKKGKENKASKKKSKKGTSTKKKKAEDSAPPPAVAETIVEPPAAAEAVVEPPAPIETAPEPVQVAPAAVPVPEPEPVQVASAAVPEPEPATADTAADGGEDAGAQAADVPAATAEVEELDPDADPEKPWLVKPRKRSVSDLQGDVFSTKEWQNKAPEKVEMEADLGNLKSMWESKAPTKPEAVAPETVAPNNADEDEDEDWTTGFGDDYVEAVVDAPAVPEPEDEEEDEEVEEVTFEPFGKTKTKYTTKAAGSFSNALDTSKPVGDADLRSQIAKTKPAPNIGHSFHGQGFYSSSALNFKAYSSSKPHKEQKYWAENASFTSASGWAPDMSVAQPYLQLDFGRLCHVGRIVTRGVADASYFTKQFSLGYSVNGIKFQRVANASGAAGVFDANTSVDDVAFNDLPVTVVCQFLRIYPHESPDAGLRLDCFVRPIGAAIGLGDGKLPASSIRTSSDKLRSTTGNMCRLETPMVSREAAIEAWQPVDKEAEPWIAFSMPAGVNLFTAIAVQGRATKAGQFMEEFEIHVKSGMSPKETPVPLGDDFAGPTVFKGNADKNGIVTIVMDTPIIAKEVWIYPKKWHKACSLRAELYTRSLGALAGMWDGSIPDTCLSASSSYSATSAPAQGRLNGGGKEGSWVHAANAPGGWYQIDLGEVKILNGVVTQGRAKKFDQWVTQYEVSTSFDGINYAEHKTSAGQDQFEGNYDGNTPITNVVEQGVIGRYVRVSPTQIYRRPAMRVELIVESVGKALGARLQGDAFMSSAAAAAAGATDPLNSQLSYKGEHGAWIGTGTDDFVQVDLGSEHALKAVVVHKKHGKKTDDAVSQFRLEYSQDGKHFWAHMEGGAAKVFDGVIDLSGLGAAAMSVPCIGKVFRICPLKWNGNCALRFGLMGAQVRNRKQSWGGSSVGNLLGGEGKAAETVFVDKWRGGLSVSGDYDKMSRGGTTKAQLSSRPNQVGSLVDADTEFGFGDNNDANE